MAPPWPRVINFIVFGVDGHVALLEVVGRIPTAGDHWTPCENRALALGRDAQGWINWVGSESQWAPW